MGVDRLAANADKRKAGIPVSSRYGTGHTHDIAHRLFVKLIEKPSFQVLKLTLISEPFAA